VVWRKRGVMVFVVLLAALPSLHGLLMTLMVERRVV
jgi:hypothetical protein